MIFLVVLALLVYLLYYLLQKTVSRFTNYFLTILIKGARLYSHINGKPYVVNAQAFLKHFIMKEPKQDANSDVQVSKVVLGNAEAVQYRNLRQKRGEKSRALIFIHGGGYVIGSPVLYDSFLKDCCDQLGCYVAALYYPLAPDSTFPGPYSHILEACKWLMKNHDKFLIDPERIAIAGDSVGGQFAASVVQDLKKDPSLTNAKLQVLIYSPFQWVDFNTPSYQQVTKHHGQSYTAGNILVSSCLSYYLIGREDWRLVMALAKNRLLSENTRESQLVRRLNHDDLPPDFKSASFYRGPVEGPCDGDLSGQFEGLLMDYRLSPIMGDLEGLPMAYVVSCGMDCFRDDSFLYCNQLQEAGVKVIHTHYGNGTHGMLMGGGIQNRLAGEMRKEIIKFMQKNL